MDTGQQEQLLKIKSLKILRKNSAATSKSNFQKKLSVLIDALIRILEMRYMNTL